jgi:hypothetical protein
MAVVDSLPTEIYLPIKILRDNEFWEFIFYVFDGRIAQQVLYANESITTSVDRRK